MRTGAPFADFTLLDSLGRNPAAELFLARRRGLSGGTAVVAVVHEELSHDRAVRRAWLDEVAPLQAVDHRGLVRLEQLGEANGTLYGAWPQVPGPSLRELGESGTPWPFPVLVQLTVQLFSSLEYLHGFLHPGLEHPLAHGDLRPSTLRVEGNALRVLELGMGRALARAGGLRRMWPPPDYAPPERGRDAAVEPRGDVYSGTLAIWEHLLPGTAAAPPRPEDVRAALGRSQLPPDARDALASALGNAPDRPAAAEVRRVMARVAHGLGAAAGPDALASFTGAPVMAAVATAPVVPSSPGDIRPGDQVGPYEVLELIAAGGMGRVWRARHSTTRELVALKTVSPDRMEDPKFLRRFIEEAKLAALLQHPNVVRILDLGQKGGTFYMAMELLVGKELAQVAHTGAPITRPLLPELAAYILARCCEGLHAAHELTDAQGRSLELVHRDVSMENIFLTRAGEVKLIDFGIAKSKLAEGLTREGVVLGKVTYMAPEQLSGVSTDRRLDLWALGVVLYWAVTGRPPFRGVSHADIIRQVLTTHPPPARDLRPGIPPRIDAILQRALAKNPDDRYPTALALRDDLQELIGARRVGPADVARCVEGHGLERGATELVAASASTEPSDLGASRPVSSTAETLEPADVTRLNPGLPELSTDVGPSIPENRRWTWKHWTVVAAAVLGGALAPFTLGGLTGANGAAADPPREGQAALEVVSTPRATVTLDGRSVGVTPLRVDADPGAHILRVEMIAADGDRGSREETLELRAGQFTRRDIRFGRGRLLLSVTPWAEVEVDGRKVGTTPFPPLPLWEGPHVLRLRNPALQVERQLLVTIQPDEDQQLSVSLTAR